MLNIQHFKVNFIEEKLLCRERRDPRGRHHRLRRFLPRRKSGHFFLSGRKQTRVAPSALHPRPFRPCLRRTVCFATPIIFSPRCAPTRCRPICRPQNRCACSFIATFRSPCQASETRLRTVTSSPSATTSCASSKRQGIRLAASAFMRG